MSRSLHTFFALVFSLLTIAPDLNGVCQLCEDIRERNRQNPAPTYPYYEDYLEAQGTKQETQAKDKSSSNRNEDQKAPQKR